MQKRRFASLWSRGAWYLRASGSGRRPQTRMARLQISGRYAYPAVRSDLTPARHFCPRATAAARCIECHADSLSCPLTRLNIPAVPGRVAGGVQGVQKFATSHKHKKVDKRSGAVCQAYYAAASRIACRRFQYDKWLKFPPLFGAHRGLPRWLQPASSTSPWFFYQVSSEVFSKASSVMSSLVLL